MKNKALFFLVLTFSLIWSCKEEPPKQEVKENAYKDLVEIEDGNYKEWYPGKKQLKYQGELNKKGERENKWSFYGEGGNLLSYTFYSEGKKNGFTLVKYPNGKVHYYGQYEDDLPVGQWVTYDLKGQKTVQDYDTNKNE